MDNNNTKDRTIAYLYPEACGKVSVTGEGVFDPLEKYGPLCLVYKDGRSYMTLDVVQGVDPATDPNMEHYMLIAEKGRDWFEDYVLINHYEGTREEFFQMIAQRIDTLNVLITNAREAIETANGSASAANEAAQNAMDQAQSALAAANRTTEVTHDAEVAIEKVAQAQTSCEQATQLADAARIAVERVAAQSVELNDLLTTTLGNADLEISQMKELYANVEALVQSVNDAESLRVSAEDKRVQAEQLRAQSDALYKSNEKSRQSAETQRGQNESARVSAEKGRSTAEGTRQTQEGKRQQAETSRQSEEQTRETQESARVSSESQRATDEGVRKQNETARVSAETGRADAESKRVSSESARVKAEEGRAGAETIRQKDEGTRQSNESARVSAEKGRSTAEGTRQTQEGERQQAETSRQSEEQTRETQESARVSSESQRAADEGVRKQNETGRVSAETGRADAESKRVSSESARAKAEEGRAGAETTRQKDEGTRQSNEGIRQANEEARKAEYETLKKDAVAATSSATAAATHAETAATTIDDKINPVVENDKRQNGRLDQIEGNISDLQKFYGADFCVGTYEEGQMAPEALEVKGSRAFALDWYPWLVDMTDNAGPKVTKAKTLKKNNWFRYGISGEFAPAVCITAEDYALCDAELYLDAGHTQKYCEAGAFDALKFYNEYGVTQELYGIDGVAIAHIRRPWETKNKDLGIGVGRKDSIRLCDMLPGRSGKRIKGIFGSQTNYDGAQFGQFVLPPTILSPTPVCTVGNKTRFFFYLMKGENRCQSGSGDNDCTDMFVNENRTYPRTDDMHQINDMNWSRANNADVNSPFPFAEGGNFALNAFITCMEVGYGSRNLHAANMFSNGVSGTDSCSNEETWKEHGGVRFKRQGTLDWQYKKWNEQSEICTDAHGKKNHMSGTINKEYPKVGVNEGQIAASYAVELGIPAGQEFQLYGATYWYENAEGATALLDGEMNCRVYKKIAGTINGYLSDGTPQVWDCEVILRIGIVHGMNLSGDIFAYWGGGYEQVGHCTVDPDVSRVGNSIYLFAEPDQTKWLRETQYQKNLEEKFDFEDSYAYLGHVLSQSDGWMLSRVPYAAYPTKKGGDLSHGECAHGWTNNYWGSLGKRVRIAARFRGFANYSNCSPRLLFALYTAVNTGRYYGGSAQVLNGAAECNALQAQ